MTAVALVVLGVAVGLCLYAYVGYPVLLAALAPRARAGHAAARTDWPVVSIVIPAHNEAYTIATTLEGVLALDYPAERRQVVVVSDASTDATDTIVSRFADRGVTLLRLSRRRGKTGAENAACPTLRGDIVINTDASVRVHPRAVKALVAALDDPTVGVASGRDVSVGRGAAAVHVGEASYVGYEMLVRGLETRLGGIVGASGCLYAIRAELHARAVPDALSRDFAAALRAREQGYRAVSVPDALCFVPRSGSVRAEYRRKVRTIARGLRTLFHHRHLLDVRRYGAFAWMLWSHKLCRWLVPWAVLAGTGALATLAAGEPAARWAAAGGAGVLLLAALGWWWPETRRPVRAFAVPAYFVAATVAALRAWMVFWRGETQPVWEPTRREEGEGATGLRASRA